MWASSRARKPVALADDDEADEANDGSFGISNEELLERAAEAAKERYGIDAPGGRRARRRRTRRAARMMARRRR